MLNKMLDWFMMGLCFGVGFALSTGTCALWANAFAHGAVGR